MTNRNILYAIVGVLAIAVGVLGYNLYQEKHKPDGVSINVKGCGAEAWSGAILVTPTDPLDVICRESSGAPVESPRQPLRASASTSQV